MMRASVVAMLMRMSEPGTSAVSRPAAPTSPMIQGPKVSRVTRSNARSTSVPVSPGTDRSAANPMKNTKSNTN